MDQKIFGSKMKPLIYKHRSKKSKRKREAFEYENNISSLLKRMKLDDTSDHESCALENNVPSNIFALETSMRKKFLKCNVKTYSSYTASESVNIYKQSKDKCVRFISFDKYIQGNVSRSPKITQFLTKRQYTKRIKRHSCIEIKNEFSFPTFTNQLEKKKILKVENVLGTFKKGVEYFEKTTNSRMGSIIKCGKNKRTYMAKSEEHEEFMSPFKLFEAENMKQFSVNFDKFNALFFQTCVNSYVKICLLSDNVYCTFRKVFQLSILMSKKEQVMPSVTDDSISSVPKRAEEHTVCLNTTVKKSLETGLSNTPNPPSSIQDLDMRSKISKTIIDLFWLELKIKKLKSLLSKFDIVSDSYNSFKKLRLKSAKLIKTYKILMDRRSKSKTSSNKVKKRNSTTRENIFVDKYASKSKEKTANLSSLNVHEENKENCPEAIAEIKGNKASKIRRNSKRKKQERESDDQEPKRSKLLDECIMRANTSKLFPVMKQNVPVFDQVKKIKTTFSTADKIPSKNESNVSNASAGQVSKTEEISKPKLPYVDPVDREISEILSQLPPIEETSNCNETLEKSSVHVGITETLHYDIGNGKIMVILPYVTI